MERKKKTPETYTSLRPVRLYMEDLEHIIELIKIRSLEINISDEDYKYDTLDEIQKYRGDIIHDLSIVAKKKGNWPLIRIGFSRENIKLFLHSEDEQIILLWHELKDFLKSKLKWYQYIFHPYLQPGILSGSIGLVVGSILGLLIYGFSPEAVKITNYIYIPFALIFLFFLIFYRQFFTILYIGRRHKVLNFWQRNRDKIILSISCVILGVALKWFLDELFK